MLPTSLKKFDLLLKKASFTLFALFMVCIAISAQGDGGIDVGLEDLLGIEEAIFGGLVYIVGLFANKIPVLKDIPATWWKIAAIGVTIGLAFILFGWSNFSGLMFAFLASTNLYEAILKLIFPTPKVDGA